MPAPEEMPEVLRAYCGAEFGRGQLELLDGIRGMPCEVCLHQAPLFPVEDVSEPELSGHTVADGESPLGELAERLRRAEEQGVILPSAASGAELLERLAERSAALLEQTSEPAEEDDEPGDTDPHAGEADSSAE